MLVAITLAVWTVDSITDPSITMLGAETVRGAAVLYHSAVRLRKDRR